MYLPLHFDAFSFTSQRLGNAICCAQTKAAFRLTDLYLALQSTLYKLKKETPRAFGLTKNMSADIGEEVLYC